MKPSPEAHAAILLSVAAKARIAARAAWRHARAHPSESTLRSAFRACVLGARSTRRAAKALSHDAPLAHRLTADAKKLEAAGAELKDQLVTAIVGK